MSLPFIQEAAAFFDSDRKGFLTHDDCANVAIGLGFYDNSSQEIFSIVRAMDTTCSGVATVPEISRELLKRWDIAMDNEPLKVFTMVADPSGHITEADIGRQLRTDRTLASKDFQLMYKNVGEDGVCSISFPAWQNLFESQS